MEDGCTRWQRGKALGATGTASNVTSPARAISSMKVPIECSVTVLPPAMTERAYRNDD
jgi:hypothetical protein